LDRQGGPDVVPRPDDLRVISRFGEEAVLDILPLARRMFDDFYATDAIHRVTDNDEMLEVVAADFGGLHPDISADAVDALKWSMSWDYR
jgi:hypothetical protein